MAENPYKAPGADVALLPAGLTRLQEIGFMTVGVIAAGVVIGSAFAGHDYFDPVNSGAGPDFHVTSIPVFLVLAGAIALIVLVSAKAAAWPAPRSRLQLVVLGGLCGLPSIVLIQHWIPEEPVFSLLLVATLGSALLLRARMGRPAST